MFKVSTEASEFVSSQKEESNIANPAVVVFERTYSSWCGPRTYVGVQVEEQNSLKGHPELTEVTEKNVDFDIFVTNDLYSELRNNASIDLMGFGPFRRLSLVR